MLHIIAVGACYLDTILTVEHYPGEDEKLRASNVVRRRGGNCPNTLEVLQQLVDPTKVKLILSAVLPSGSSAGTQQIKSSFGPAVDLSRCTLREEFDEPASSYIIKSTSTGSRTIVNHNELPEMTTEEFIAMADELGDKASWYHFEGRIPEVTLGCMLYLRQHFPAIKVSVEVEKPARVGLTELAAQADVVFYSKSWALGYGCNSPQCCLGCQASTTEKASLLCCTWGDEGAAALELSNGNDEYSDAWVSRGRAVVDTIGAGDTFIAGMLYGLTCHNEDWTLKEKLAFANELAGRKVTQEGFFGLGAIMRNRL